MGHDQRKDRPRFSESVTADSEISSPLCGNYTLWELPSSSGKSGQEFLLVCSLTHAWLIRLMSQCPCHGVTQFTTACLSSGVIMGSHDSEDSGESWEVCYCKKLELSFPKNMAEMIQSLKGMCYLEPSLPSLCSKFLTVTLKGSHYIKEILNLNSDYVTKLASY